MAVDYLERASKQSNVDATILLGDLYSGQAGLLILHQTLIGHSIIIEQRRKENHLMVPINLPKCMSME